MGARRDKGLALARFLTGHTGIPMLSWTGNGIDAPPPYFFDVTTSRSLEKWHNHLRGYKDTGSEHHFAIRYDLSMDSVGQAWVGMSMDTFVTLLSAHYESIRPRVQTYIEGD